MSVDTEVLRPSDLQFEISIFMLLIFFIFMLHEILIFCNIRLKLESISRQNQLTLVFLANTTLPFLVFFGCRHFSQMKLNTKLLLKFMIVVLKYNDT